MTDKQILETFRSLKEHCKSKKDCETCRFYYTTNESCGHCQLEEIGWMLAISPKYWNIEEIEWIMDK